MNNPQGTTPQHETQWLAPIKILDVEASGSLRFADDLTAYRTIHALIRWHGVPIGWVYLPVVAGGVDSDLLRQRILEQLNWPILKQALSNALRTHRIEQPIEQILTLPGPTVENLPSVSVAVCTRDRPGDLERCLKALLALRGPVKEILVIDNAPSDEGTKSVVTRLGADRGAEVRLRYIREPRPGLDWARNRAVLEATGDIVAFTDDDTIADPSWALAIAEAFAENPNIGAVTGLVIPDELETDAQIIFELNGGFGRGFKRFTLFFPDGRGMSWGNLGTGSLGTGANMAFRRSIFEETGLFDPALDVGTPTHGAGDLEMFYRVLRHGYPFVYEPKAVIRHRHRRAFTELKKQIRNNGSFYAMMVRSVMHDAPMLGKFTRLGFWWLWNGQLRPAITGSMFERRVPRELYTAQLAGSIRGLTSYFQSSRAARDITAQFGGLEPTSGGQSPRDRFPASRDRAEPEETAIRVVHLETFEVPSDAANYARVRLYLCAGGNPVGHIDINNQYQPIGAIELSQRLVDTFPTQIMALTDQGGDVTSVDMQAIQWSKTMGRILSRLSEEPPSAAAVPAIVEMPKSRAAAEKTLDQSVAVSVIVATHDRPNDLRACLDGLVRQKTSRNCEIIVVDNNPMSGKTPLIVAAFPGVRLVSETRKGVAYARNAGIAASSGDIIITVDDDVVAPSDWLEKLITPFVRADVMCVTGNVFPFELRTVPQHLFETYGEGGLGRGYTRFEVDRSWFDKPSFQPVPTWKLGGTANSAYRRSVFFREDIGLMDEALGPGMPSGVGEDIYLFYKILKANGTIVYQPGAYIWHKHRRSMAELRRQIYGYSKGFTSYQLTTLLKDGDYRALPSLAVELPRHRLRQIWRWIRGDRYYPLSLILLEWRGNLSGFWALWRSRRIVEAQGRSQPIADAPARAVRVGAAGTYAGFERASSAGSTSGLNGTQLSPDLVRIARIEAASEHGGLDRDRNRVTERAPRVVDDGVQMRHDTAESDAR